MMNTKSYLVALALTFASAAFGQITAPLEETQFILPADASNYDGFGNNGMDMDGDYAIFGSPKDDDAGSNIGAAYIYQKSGASWTMVKKLIPTGLPSGAGYGWHTSIEGDYAVVGCTLSGSGKAAYVYKKNLGGPNNWGLLKTINLPITIFSPYVFFEDGYVLISNPYAGASRSKAYIFHIDQGGVENFGLVTELTTSLTTGPNIQFGSWSGFNGEVAVIGTQGYQFAIFAKDEGGANNWGEVTTGTGIGFVSIIKDDMLITGHRGSGWVKIFKKDQGGVDNWGHFKTISGTTAEQFGASLALVGDHLVVGANTASIPNGDQPGGIYVFEKDLGGVENWGQYQLYTPSHEVHGQFFGYSMTADDNGTVMVGSYNHNVQGPQSGGVYVMESGCLPTGFNIPDLTIECSQSTICVPLDINQTIPNGLFGLDFSMTYDENQLTPTGNATLGPVATQYANYSLNTTVPGTVFGTIYLNAAPLGTFLSGQGNVICVEFDLNASVEAGDVLPITTGDVEGGGFVAQRYCGEEDAMITVINEPLEGTLEYRDAGEILAYDEANPGAFNATTVTGNNGDCDAASAVSVTPDLTGAFTYDTDNGDHVQISRDIAGDYDSFNADPLSAADVMAVINSVDFNAAAEISNYLNASPSVYELLAADVNLDGRVNSTDAALISYRTINSPLTYAEFPQSNYTFTGTGFAPTADYAPSRDWLFIDQTTLQGGAFTSGMSRNSVPTVPACLPVNMLDNGSCVEIAPEIYVGVLLGDVDGNWTAAGQPTLKTAPEVLVDLSKAVVSGNEYVVPVSLSAAAKGLDFIWDYDEAKIEVIRVDAASPSHDYLWNDQVEQKLYTSMYDITTAEAGEVVAYIVLKTEEVLSADHFDGVVGYVDGVSAAFRYESVVTGVEDALVDQVAIYPNPAIDQVTVAVGQVVQSTLTDAFGKTLRVMQLQQGLNEVQLDGLSAGVYFLEVAQQSFKVVIQ